ncbi:hypothetical protein HPP92_000087 [Vanilla planifolia]|uniref:beta-galactosidase n=1 Tax=Vanilla planifolia TaxID=51239 RepID=A0A835RNH6_VANPL|nr:hypothetical protein HPP92_000087 [Vanilla planifolia]
MDSYAKLMTYRNLKYGRFCATGWSYNFVTVENEYGDIERVHAISHKSIFAIDHLHWKLQQHAEENAREEEGVRVQESCDSSRLAIVKEVVKDISVQISRGITLLIHEAYNCGDGRKGRKCQHSLQFSRATKEVEDEEESACVLSTMPYAEMKVRYHVDVSEKFLSNGSNPVLMVESKGHGVHVFVNEELIASAFGNGTDITYKLETHIPLKAGKNVIALLSMTVGLQNAGPFYEWVGAGLTNVKISGLNNGTIDLSSYAWKYKIGLEGEHLRVFSVDGNNNVKWTYPSEPPKNQALTWYKVVVDAPNGTAPVGLDMQHMGKGLAWLNGKAIGRYWPRTSSINDKCSESCNYRGKFFPDKCRTGCGSPTQRWYHVPLSWFRPSGNVLVIFEEKGGDPTKIAFSRRRITQICSFVSEDYPSIDLDDWDNAIRSSGENSGALHLACPDNTSISSISFASFGNPSGTCRSYHLGTCHLPSSVSIVEKACLNKRECSISLSSEEFFNDSCPGITKSFAVEAVCG